MELCDQLDCADDAGVLRAQVLSGDPVLQDRLTAHLVDLVLAQEGPADPEARHVSRAGLLDVPIASDHGGVLLIEHRVEDRLTWQPERPCSPSRRFNQPKFFRSRRPPQGHGLGFFAHALNDPPS